jgi:REP element-mobilizing transposase RayT
MKYKPVKQYRLPEYDYSSTGDYFITICIKDKICYFGKIEKTQDNKEIMRLSPIGEYARQAILAIPSKYPAVELGEWIIMPNHVHLILSIRQPDNDNRPRPAPTHPIYSQQRGLQPIVSGSVSSVINHFKGHVKKWCNRNGYPDFNWQTRFHDHIIRDTESYNIISNYIATNVANWDNDSLYLPP